MSRRLFISFSFLLVSFIARAQEFKSFVEGKKWILETEKAEKSNSLKFIPYAKEKVTLNTMIWVFEANGSIEYDYQSDDDVEACLGVDFLDLDVDACQWKLNTVNNTILLTIKGGYASIDDFIFKNEYEFQTKELENQDLGFELMLKKKIFFRKIN